ncbi:hypothetical protein GQ44DRAFT_759811 [Phaeosphaeriaceae sp. PMI808]|nr:hypothetical protein GQ44DRAFT_759811 [Phaeosphaeriaceae sp. PMI808]
MDHLPTPFNTSGPPIEIPFVADIPWDSGDFASFPSRHGFAVTLDGDLDLDRINTERLASLLQSWLYFGFLSEILEINVRKKIFRRVRPAYSTKPVAVILNSSCLTPLIETWSKTIRRQNSRSFILSSRKEVENLVAMRDKVRTQFNRLLRTCDLVAQHSTGCPYPLPEILLSILILCNTLVLCGELDIQNERNRPVVAMSVSLIGRQMIDGGWCRAIVDHASKKYYISDFYFLSRVKPPAVPWIRHKTCSKFQCRANNVSKGPYQNRHVTKNCPCHLIHIDGDNKTKLFKIIKGGGVPLIKIRELVSGSVKLEVREYKPSVSYFAISHVWSDGLGNPDANALPLCQLRKLAKSLGELRSCNFAWSLFSGSVWFWMDTLCIPPAEEGTPDFELRLDCIDRMASIYASAQRVLVLDYGLQQVRLGACLHAEVLAHLICCAWNQRCWTLQEGALGRYILFQLSDGFVDSSGHFYTRLREHKTFMLFRMLKSWQPFGGVSKKFERSLKGRFLSSLNDTLRGMENLSATYSFAQAWNAMNGRSTTKPNDTHVVLANLLGFHAYQLSELPEKDRLKAIIMNSKFIPRSLLYNTGNRVIQQTSEGQRWLPVEINSMKLSGGPQMEVKPEGFIICPKKYIQGFRDSLGEGRVQSYLKKTRAIMKSSLPGLIVFSLPIAEESGPVWIRCGSLTKKSSHSLMDLFIRVDLFRLTSHKRYDPTIFKESCVLIDEEEGNELLSKAGTTYRGALLHVRRSTKVLSQFGTQHPILARLPFRLSHHAESIFRYLSSTRRGNLSTSQPSRSHTGAHDEVFHAVYDCPARVTIYSEKTLKKKVRKSVSDIRYERLNPQFEDSAQDLLFPPPWERGHDQYDVSRITMPPPSVIQDDCRLEKSRHMDIYLQTHKTHKGFSSDAECAIRFPQDWKLIMETSATKLDMPLVQRPHPRFDRGSTPNSPLLWTACVLRALPPIIVLIIVSVFTFTSVHKSAYYVGPKICIIGYGVSTIILIFYANFFLIVLVWQLALFYILIIIMNGWSRPTMPAWIASFVGIPCLVISLTVVSFFSVRIGHKYWLSTFDRDWRPENTNWWLRPFSLWNSGKRLMKLKKQSSPQEP